MSNVISLCAVRNQVNAFADRFFELGTIINQTPAQQKEFAQMCAQFTPQQLADLAALAQARAESLSNQ